jgi:hypothetical protein
MREAGHVACMGHRRGTYRVSVGRPEGREHLEELGVDGMMMIIIIIIKFTFTN